MWSFAILSVPFPEVWNRKRDWERSCGAQKSIFQNSLQWTEWKQGFKHRVCPSHFTSWHTTDCRPERWIVTIPSSDQWLATIGNHWKTIVSNGWRTIKPLKNHCYQWFLDPKTIGKPLLPIVLVTKNHWKTIASNGFWTKNHWKTIATNGFGDQKPS